MGQWWVQVWLPRGGPLGSDHVVMINFIIIIVIILGEGGGVVGQLQAGEGGVPRTPHDPPLDVLISGGEFDLLKVTQMSLWRHPTETLCSTVRGFTPNQL